MRPRLAPELQPGNNHSFDLRLRCCLDNAAAELFLASFRTELVYRIVLPTMTLARPEIVACSTRPA